MSKVFIVSTSLRGGSNSEILAKECARGAADAGSEVEFVSLKGKKLSYCIGCLSCQKTGRCVLKDDAAELLEKVRNADTLVFATPIYYYEMSGQMKTFLDRLNPLYPAEYRFRKVYLIATAADGGSQTFEKAYSGLRGWVDCFEKATLSGFLTGDEICDAGEATKHPDVMARAYAFGKALH